MRQPTRATSPLHTHPNGRTNRIVMRFLRTRAAVYETEGHRFESCRARSTFGRNLRPFDLVSPIGSGGSAKATEGHRHEGDALLPARAPPDRGLPGAGCYIPATSEVDPRSSRLESRSVPSSSARQGPEPGLDRAQS